MGGTTTISAAEYELTFFTAQMGEPPMTHVTAVVIWRGRRATIKPHDRAFWRALWPLRRPKPSDRPLWTMPPEWDGASDGGGPHEVLHSMQRRAVRVAGQEHALPPDGRTLVLLVAAGDRSTVGPQISARVLAVAPEPAPRLDRELPKEAMLRLVHEQHARVWQRLDEALAADSSIGAFMHHGRTPDPPNGSFKLAGE